MREKPALQVLATPFSIHRLAPDAAIPSAVFGCRWYWIGRTDEETSIVCPSPIGLPGARTEPGWACIRVVGPIDFAVTGLLADIAGVLAADGVSIFALSTFDTDYILVRSDRIADARRSLRAAGYDLRDAGGTTDPGDGGA